MVSHLGRADGDAFLCCRSLSGTEGRTGVRGGHSHCHHSGGRFYSRQTFEGAGRECDYPVDRRLLRCCGGWCHLHLAGYLYPTGEVS